MLLGGVPGVPRGNVVILGAGIVGMNALRTAVGLGADVSILDVNLDRLRHVEELYGNAVVTLMSNSFNVEQAVRRADLVVGAVLVAGARAPVLVTKEMVATMKAEKGLDPNVDFFSASTYYALGIPVDLYTPIFAIARISGWCTHVEAQLAHNRLIRPRAQYVGKRDLRYVPADQR